MDNEKRSFHFYIQLIRRKKMFWGAIIIFTLLSISIIYYNDYENQNFMSKKYKSDKIESFILNDSIDNILNHQMFTDFCFKILQNKHNLEINSIRQDSQKNQSTCLFYKQFKPNFIRWIFGVKLYIYRGSLSVEYPKKTAKTKKSAFSFESEWIKHYNDNWNFELDKNQFKHLLNENTILEDIRNGGN